MGSKVPYEDFTGTLKLASAGFTVNSDPVNFILSQTPPSLSSILKYSLGLLAGSVLSLTILAVNGSLDPAESSSKYTLPDPGIIFIFLAI